MKNIIFVILCVAVGVISGLGVIIGAELMDSPSYLPSEELIIFERTGYVKDIGEPGVVRYRYGEILVEAYTVIIDDEPLFLCGSPYTNPYIDRSIFPGNCTVVYTYPGAFGSPFDEPILLDIKEVNK